MANQRLVMGNEGGLMDEKDERLDWNGISGGDQGSLLSMAARWVE